MSARTSVILDMQEELSTDSRSMYVTVVHACVNACMQVKTHAGADGEQDVVREDGGDVDDGHGVTQERLQRGTRRRAYHNLDREVDHA